MLPDRSGQWRTDKGWKLTSGGKKAQHRFYLGRDKTTASLAENRLVAFWEALTAYFEHERKGEPCLFEEWSLFIAKDIAESKLNISLPHPPASLVALFPADPDIVAAAWQQQLADYFGSVVGFSEAKQAQGAYEGQGVFRPAKARSTGETFFQAIDSHVAYLHNHHKTTEGITSQTGVKHGEQMQRLKRHHPNFPLSDLDGKKIDGLLHHWSKRPVKSDDGKRFSYHTCKNQITLLKAFLRWLHASEFTWKLPADFLFRRQRIEWTQEEKRSMVNKKRTFTIAEIKTLWDHALPRERVFIAFALNCAFGQGELSTLAEEEINSKLIKRVRNKTIILGAWYLWNVTKEAIEYARKLKAINGFESPLLLLTTTGKPFDNPTKGNNVVGKIGKIWNGLIERVRSIEEHKDFPRLSFGKLRKTSASWVRRLGGGELGSIHISHGSATGDVLLDVYADRQFRTLFKVHRKIGRRLEGVLTGGFPDPVKAVPRKTVEAKAKRILALRKQGFKLTYIAKETSVPQSTVARILKQNKADEAK